MDLDTSKPQPPAQSLDPDPANPTDVQSSKIDLEDIPARVAERAPDVLPNRMLNLSYLVVAAVLVMIVVALILFAAMGMR